MPTQRRLRRPAPPSRAGLRIGMKLRLARARAGLSQAQLGSPHFTRAYVSAVELGKVQPSVKSLEFLASKLDLPLAYFLALTPRELAGPREVLVAKAWDLVGRGRAEDAVELLVSALTQLEDQQSVDDRPKG